MQKKYTVREMVYAALFCALLAVCSMISIPAAVPFTLQTFAVSAALCILGARLGGLAIAAWILLGAAGAPVFSNFTGGLGALAGATGGYILGFLFSPPLYALAMRLPLRREPVKQAIGLVLSLIGVYTFGTVWYSAVYAGGSTLSGAFATCVLPFLLPDALKLSLALSLSRAVKFTAPRPRAAR